MCVCVWVSAVLDFWITEQLCVTGGGGGETVNENKSVSDYQNVANI